MSDRTRTAHDDPQPRYLRISGHRIGYLDTGSGSRTVLMVHGNPTGALVYRRLISRLQGRFRCVAPDLLGFGASDKPTRESDYSLERHIRLVGDLVARLRLKNIIIVAHDWGGPIGFGAALKEPGRYTHLVALNTFTLPKWRVPPVYWIPFHLLVRARCLRTLLIRRFPLFQKFGLAIMEPDDRAPFMEANKDTVSRAAIAAFPTMIPYRKSHPSYPLLREILNGWKSWEIPSLLLFSDRDSVFDCEDARRFTNQLHAGTFRRFRGSRHFIQYEAPQEVAEAIIEFIYSTEAAGSRCSSD